MNLFHLHPAAVSAFFWHFPKRSKNPSGELKLLDLSVDNREATSRTQKYMSTGHDISSDNSRTQGRLTATTSSQVASEPRRAQVAQKNRLYLIRFGRVKPAVCFGFSYEKASQNRLPFCWRDQTWYPDIAVFFCRHSFLCFSFLSTQEMKSIKPKGLSEKIFLKVLLHE